MVVHPLQCLYNFQQVIMLYSAQLLRMRLWFVSPASYAGLPSNKLVRDGKMSRPETSSFSKGAGLAARSRLGQRGYYSEIVGKSAAKYSEVCFY